MTVTRKEHQVLANGQPATYTEQVAAYNKPLWTRRGN